MRSLHWILIALIAMPIGAVNSQPTTTGAVQVSVGVGNVAPDDANDEPVSSPNADVLVFSSKASNLIANPGSGLTGGRNIYRYAPTTGIELLSKSTLGGFPTVDSDRTLAADSKSPAVSATTPEGVYAVAFTSDADNLISGYQPTDLGNYFNQVYVTFPSLSPSQTTLISVSDLGAAIAGNNDSEQPTIAIKSATKAGIAVFKLCFRSSATNLKGAPAISQSNKRLYCVDITVNSKRKTVTPGTIAQVGGDFETSNVATPSLSGDATYLAFALQALSCPSVGCTSQIYLYNFASQKSELMSRSTSGAPGSSQSLYPSVSYNGDTVVFKTEAGGDVGGISNANNAVIISYNTSKQQFSQVNTSASGVSSDGSANSAAVDARGRFVTFSDTASNLIDGDTTDDSNTQTQVYLKDLKTGNIIRTSVTTGGALGDSASGEQGFGLGRPLSAGGLGFNSRTVYASFNSSAENLKSFASPGQVEVLRSEITLPKRPLTKNATIEAPADIKILRKRRKAADLKINFQDFEIDLTQFDAATSASATMDTASRARLRYTATIRKAGSKKRITRISSRNSVTIRKLSAGRYTVRYRVTATRGRRSVRSQTSPKATVAIS